MKTDRFVLSGVFHSFGTFVIFCSLLTLGGCVGVGTSTSPSPQPQPKQPGGEPAARPLDPQQAERLQRLMLPLLKVMDHPVKSGQAEVGVIDTPEINAGSAGNGQFVVTTGLLQRANDDQLQAVLAHEVAHDDLGHVAKTQRVGAGLSIARVVLDQIIPGSSIITPIAGTLAIRAYGRKEEYEADKHGVELLRKIKPNGKEMMVDALTWLRQTAGDSGGFFATHPDTGDRISRLKEMP